MKKIIIFVILTLIFIPNLTVANQFESVSINSTEDTVRISLKATQKFQERKDLIENIRIEICKGKCHEAKIHSLSFTQGSRKVDLFIKPDRGGNLIAKVKLKGEILHSENVSLKNEINQRKKNNIGITGRFMSGEANSLIILALISFLLIFIYKHSKIKFKGLSKYLHRIEPIFIFLVSFFLISTSFHELFHIAALEFFSCPFELNISPLEPKSVAIGSCPIGLKETIIILSSGLVGNFLIFLGSILLFLKKDALRTFN
ncbi:MAG: hypothetical protein ABEK17_04730, partial [Candidatus Aenigmatarchaeota archaeon]